MSDLSLPNKTFEKKTELSINETGVHFIVTEPPVLRSAQSFETSVGSLTKILSTVVEGQTKR